MAHARARQLVQLNRRCLDDLATNALERETLTREDLDEIFAAHELRRTLVPGEEDEELVSEALPRFRTAGTMLPQRTQRDEPSSEA